MPRARTVSAVPRGRTRDEDARRRVLDATFELVGANDPGSVTIDRIVERAGVAKQTVYRWWPSRSAVVLDALVDGTMRATPFPDTGDVRADFEAHLRAVVRLFRSPTGRLIRELLADAQTDAAAADEFRERFWAPRRDLSRERLAAGIESGRIRRDIDAETVLDALYGPLWLRLTIEHRPLTSVTARHAVATVFDGIAAG